jgi:uncharacterized membrane protein
MVTNLIRILLPRPSSVLRPISASFSELAMKISKHIRASNGLLPVLSLLLIGILSPHVVMGCMVSYLEKETDLF